MANDFTRVLKAWHAKKDEQQWVLATIYETDGSSYRKAGAHMMINDLGQFYGLLSGGCLESDIMRQARRCWESNENRLVQYDMREEEDLAWQLGIGCGGLVKIILQPVNHSNQYLYLDTVYACLIERGYGQYEQIIDKGSPKNRFRRAQQRLKESANLIIDAGECKLVHNICPAVHLTLVGGGVDARPVARIASELGWHVALVDPRPSHARKEHFTFVNDIYPVNPTSLMSQREQGAFLAHTDAIVIMSHSVELDAQGLQMAQSSHARYVGLLGPLHRTERVFEKAGLLRDAYPIKFANPIGLRLGGELPESIALSIIAEIHGFLHNANCQSISGVIQ